LRAIERKAKEAQNQVQFDDYAKGAVHLGPYSSHIWKTDPRHLGFLLARYKFVAKMLEGKERVLEIGMGDGLGIPVVAQTVGHVHAVDWEPLLFDDNGDRLAEVSCSFECLDITEDGPDGAFDAAYSLDVLEHIAPEREGHYFENVCAALHQDGVFIVGTPNVTARAYATTGPDEGHINLKSWAELKRVMSERFVNLFMFSMNDEVVHTGYGPMAHYLMAMGVGVRRRARTR